MRANREQILQSSVNVLIRTVKSVGPKIMRSREVFLSMLRAAQCRIEAGSPANELSGAQDRQPPAWNHDGSSTIESVRPAHNMSARE